MSAARRFLDQRFYPDQGDHWDADLFRRWLDPWLERSKNVLDFGAGRGALPQMNLGDRRGRHVAGVDVDAAVLDNPYLDEARLIEPSGRIPHDDSQFDLVVASNVLEHLPDPVATFAEIHRVLQPGGVFISKTPNRRHYVPVIARVTPHQFHVWINRRRGRQQHDTFPTHYRANTPGRIRSLARDAGFSVERLELVEGRPEYLRQSVPLYLAGMLYERTVNAVPFLAGFRVVMMSALRRGG